MTSAVAASHGVVVFDGVCNLCSHAVQFIVAHETAPTLQFAALQSAAGARLMRELELDPVDAKTFVLIEDGAAYFRSAAAIRLARRLRLPWRLLALVRVVPRPLRDCGYDLVARHRYRWFGRRESCSVSDPTLAARFLAD